MKHLIETAGLSGLPITEYDRIILDSDTDDVIVRGGVNNANILIVSGTGYQLFGEEGDNGQINYWAYEYAGTEEYNGKEYFKYSHSETDYILAPTRSITKVTFPFDDYYMSFDGEIHPFLEGGADSLYGFTSVPENKILMKRRTDIGTNANGKDYVDLGLTSGTLWATMNVGATSETDYGSYFQWGDTVDKRDAVCDWSNYKYGDGSNFSKYNTGFNNIGGTIDNKITLDLDDDAARANMGGDWRIPSPALMEELISETKSEWVKNFNGSGVNGRKFTSKTDESKYIFIPASSRRSGSSFDGRGGYCVWSSSLDTIGPDNAWSLTIDSNYSNIGVRSDTNRSIGLVVRGVL